MALSENPRRPQGLVEQMDQEAKNITSKEIPREYQQILDGMQKEDIQVILDLLLHNGENSSLVNDFVKKHTPGGELADYQKVLLAPANGIESMVTFLGGLFTKNGLNDLWEGLKNIDEAPETLKALWYTFYNKLNGTQKLAVGIEFATNFIVAAKIIAFFCRMMKVVSLLVRFGPYEANLMKAGRINWAWIGREARGVNPILTPNPNNPFGITAASSYLSMPVVAEKTLDVANNLQSLGTVSDESKK